MDDREGDEIQFVLVTDFCTCGSRKLITLLTWAHACLTVGRSRACSRACGRLASDGGSLVALNSFLGATPTKARNGYLLILFFAASMILATLLFQSMGV
ncbi:MAG: hypothetical protein ACKO1F_04585 [Flammeovirgaceae bacterium]